MMSMYIEKMIIFMFQLNKKNIEQLDQFLKLIKNLMIVYFMMLHHGQLQIFMILITLLH